MNLARFFMLILAKNILLRFYFSMSINRVNPSFTSGLNYLPEGAVIVSQKLIKGASPSFLDVFRLKKAGVTQILDFRHKSIQYVSITEKIACMLANIKYKRIPTDFKSGKFAEMDFFEKINEKINAQKLTYGHCNSGTHRSVLISASHLRLSNLKTPKETLKWLIEQQYFTKYSSVRKHPECLINGPQQKEVFGYLKATYVKFREMFHPVSPQ